MATPRLSRSKTVPETKYLGGPSPYFQGRKGEEQAKERRSSPKLHAGLTDEVESNVLFLQTVRSFLFISGSVPQTPEFARQITQVPFVQVRNYDIRFERGRNIITISSHMSFVL